MKNRYTIALVLSLATTAFQTFAQDSLITKIAKNDLSTFTLDKNELKGKGWDILEKEIRKSDFVLIGEDHFTNEIPAFTSAIVSKVKFDNFFAETDPYSANIIESKLKNTNDAAVEKYRKEFGEVFGFFALEPEYQLLKQLVKANTTVYGTDQILMNADRLICNDLKVKTKNETARKIYEDIEKRSKTCFADFLKDPSKPMYMMTDDFENQLSALKKLSLSPEEIKKIDDLKLSAKIYKEQNHHLRIQLMKNSLMNVYPEWQNKKNLFKFGAIHISKGESFFKIYDIGNLVNNIADSKFKKSLHIMILGKTGTKSGPFKGFPDQPIDENGDFNFLKPIFANVTSDEWHCFDMKQLRDAKEHGKIVVKDITLSRVIDGYDYVIVIPKVTAARFPASE